MNKNRKVNTNTNTNTNNRKEEKKMSKINLGEISKKASKLYHDFISVNPSAKGLATWYECMREAVKEQKISDILPKAISNFFDLPENVQHEILEYFARLVPKAVLQEYHYNANGEKVFNSPKEIEWMLSPKDGGKRMIEWNDCINRVVTDAYIYLSEKIEKCIFWQLEKGYSVQKILLHVCGLCAKKIGRELIDKPSRMTANDASLDNEKFSFALSFNQQYYEDSTEEKAIAESFIESACNDSLDRLIQHGKQYGLNQHEIGNACKISQVAVSKRMKRMKERIEVMNKQILIDEVNNTIFYTAEVEYQKKHGIKTKRTENATDGRFYQYSDNRYIHSIPYIEEEGNEQNNK